MIDPPPPPSDRSGTSRPTPSAAPEPALSIVMPALNEERHIAAALASLADDDPRIREILVLDGGSRDRTRAIVAELARHDPRIRLLDNPGRLQAAAVNRAAGLADPAATVLVRADCHAVYPSGFAAAAAARLRAVGADSLVVPLLTAGTAPLQRAIAATQNSRLGNGGAAHRRPGEGGFVDHGHHAAFDRAVFQRVGGYDERFSHNEDAELDLRLAQAGGRIWLEPALAVTYFPRDRLGALARQYFNYGAGRVRTLRKHRRLPRPRQIAPVLILAGTAAALAVAPWLPAALALPAAYLLLCCGWGGVAALRRRDPALLAMGPAAVTMHLSWGAGFLRGLARRAE